MTRQQMCPLQQSGAEMNKNIALTLVMIHSKNITEILRNNVPGKITSHLHIILVIKLSLYSFHTSNFLALLISCISLLTVGD